MSSPYPYTRFWSDAEQRARRRTRSGSTGDRRAPPPRATPRTMNVYVLVVELEQRRDQDAAEAGEHHRAGPTRPTTCATRSRRAGRRVARGRRRRASRARAACGAARATARRPRSRRDEHGDLVRVELTLSSPSESRCQVSRGTGRCPRTVPDPPRDAGGHRQTEVEDGVPERLDQPERERGERDEEADRADDPRVHRRSREPPQQHAVERETRAAGRRSAPEIRPPARSAMSWPVFSWKKKYAVTNATAPCAKLKMPDVW